MPHKKYDDVDRGITPEDVARHLRGEAPSLLSIPILPGGNCHFGAIDIDRHNPEDPPVDHAALARRVTELRLQLVVCRSTNGRGAWLFLFLIAICVTQGEVLCRFCSQRGQVRCSRGNPNTVGGLSGFGRGG